MKKAVLFLLFLSYFSGCASMQSSKNLSELETKSRSGSSINNIFLAMASKHCRPQILADEKFVDYIFNNADRDTKRKNRAKDAVFPDQAYKDRLDYSQKILNEFEYKHYPVHGLMSVNYSGLRAKSYNNKLNAVPLTLGRRKPAFLYQIGFHGSPEPFLRLQPKTYDEGSLGYYLGNKIVGINYQTIDKIDRSDRVSSPSFMNRGIRDEFFFDISNKAKVVITNRHSRNVLSSELLLPATKSEAYLLAIASQEKKGIKARFVVEPIGCDEKLLAPVVKIRELIVRNSGNEEIIRRTY